jgi:phosphoribosylformylglycinamidine synthase
VRACHDLSEGGLAVAIAEMAFAGGWGATLDLSRIEIVDAPAVDPREMTMLRLFAESNSRFLCEVPAGQTAAFARHLAGVPHVELGEVSSSDELRIVEEDRLILTAPIAELKEAWQKPLRWS